MGIIKLRHLKTTRIPLILTVISNRVKNHFQKTDISQKIVKIIRFLKIFRRLSFQKATKKCLLFDFHSHPQFTKTFASMLITI